MRRFACQRPRIIQRRKIETRPAKTAHLIVSPSCELVSKCCEVTLNAEATGLRVGDVQSYARSSSLYHPRRHPQTFRSAF